MYAVPYYCLSIRRRVPLVEKELLTRPKHLNTPPVTFLFDSCCSIFSFLRNMFSVDHCPFSVVIVLSVRLRLAASGIFKLFF